MSAMCRPHSAAPTQHAERRRAARASTRSLDDQRDEAAPAAAGRRSRGRRHGRRDRRAPRRRCDITTITHGACSIDSPTSCARRTRNASEKRASVSTTAIAVTTIERAVETPDVAPRRSCARPRAARRAGSSHAEHDQQHAQRRRHDARSRTPRGSCRRNTRCAPTASSGPAIAPTVSSAWRSPNAAPRTLARREVGDQRIARRAADALADAIGEARADDPAERASRAGTRASTAPRVRSRRARAACGGA